ncbi:MAG: putative rane protein [Herbinix sp.]|nr:putative rane protein [Herbinix sp.]
MNKKNLIGLILFACFVTATLYLSANLLMKQGVKAEHGQVQTYTKEDNNNKSTEAEQLEESSSSTEIQQEEDLQNEDVEAPALIPEEVTQEEEDNSEIIVDVNETEPWLSTNPSDMGSAVVEETTASTEVHEAPDLILDSNDVDYEKYIPQMIIDNVLETALDISNPGIDVDAEAAILLDAETNEVLYYKNAVQAEFPASTAKLLTSLVALSMCSVDEQVTLGDELSMIASDSTRANLKSGEVLTIHNLLEGMLLPSGNDAAYAVAAYVGRKSLVKPDASKEEAVEEFIRLMNEYAEELGVKNSCFKTPDGYDAIGQYTTAYDMGLIGVAAANNEIITEISQKSKSRNIFISGRDVTWINTNKLITQYSGQYYSKAIGLKTGTSTMAGRCLIAAAEQDGKRVVCVVMDSSSAGRWEDAISLLQYGLE